MGLDALSSAAYGPEAALSLLIPLGLVGVHYIVPISAAIITLLVIVYFSYRQTIAAYPSGGGSYTVARFNLGAPAGLLAAAALLADYILTAAVGISAGVGALISAVPSLLPHTVSLCVGILIVITILNFAACARLGLRLPFLHICLWARFSLRSLRDCPGAGEWRTSDAGGGAACSSAGDGGGELLAAAQGFRQRLHGVDGSGGGEQWREGFKEPRVKNAQRTLTVIIFLLAVMLAGISYPGRELWHRGHRSGAAGISEPAFVAYAAVFGKGVFYYLTMGSILVVLSLSANTAFADFPRLCRAIAQNNYLPHAFGYRGGRLVYTYGIVIRAALCGGVLILFGGVTDRLIPCMRWGRFWLSRFHSQGW